MPILTKAVPISCIVGTKATRADNWLDRQARDAKVFGNAIKYSIESCLKRCADSSGIISVLQKD